ncbi:alkaline phosphatase PafA [Pedobacter insulae]|uniref:Type I phosphodiesterase / nucleotide pyrophosphatase n=1 Tax=Pedobacter insulae TaxID=414048 RepID=A0A1I2UWD8_9SPHI|nr:alkaline phosphatase PafA [Pedobacter insulae]SFG80499.1 Type I phosphodiesterase / nucleotide pyrophosphatase [Pedobacter insulae]
MRINKTLPLLVLLLLSQLSWAQKKNPSTIPRPKLVVGIMVDQMRWDYLYRFYDRYSDKGFKRMLNEGFNCENTYINHLPTVTGIGHSTVYTGSVPAIHGITGNSITFNATGKSVNCVADDNVESVGIATSSGKKSPVNLLVTTIGDELKLATNFRSKVIGLAVKDRGAILPAGHAADAAYWFDTKSGKWITSTYYMDKLPQWVDGFNNQNLAEKYLLGNWNTLYPIDTYIQSSPDKAVHEGLMKGQQEAVFPIETSKLFTKDSYEVIYTTPFGNSITLDFAKTVIANEKMGKGKETDLLAVSLSSPDAIGHLIGMNSVEIEDTYLRLDRDLAEFFKYLDAEVGKGEYTVFLTADHGATHNPKFLEEHKIPVFASQPGLQNRLNTLLEKKFTVKNLVSGTSYSQIRFNYKALNEHQLNEEAIRDVCVNFLRKEPNVLFVVDLNKVGEAAVPQEIKERIVNGHHPDRSGGIFYILTGNTGSLNAKGSSHSEWLPDDAKIPLLWMGWGIKKGRSLEQRHMVDIAPTVSSLLRIQPPNGNIGKAISEVLIVNPAKK